MDCSCIVCQGKFTSNNPLVRLLDAAYCRLCCAVFASNPAAIPFHGVKPEGGFSGETLPADATPEERRACFRLLKGSS